MYLPLLCCLAASLPLQSCGTPADIFSPCLSAPLSPQQWTDRKEAGKRAYGETERGDSKEKDLKGCGWMTDLASIFNNRVGESRETGLRGDEKDLEGLKEQKKKECESQRVVQHIEGE